MKETNAYLHCPLCQADMRLDGMDINGVAYMVIPLHVKGRFPDAGDEHDSMLAAESSHDPCICSTSEQLLRVVRQL